MTASTSMVPLLLLGAHLTGDFILQTSYMAANKMASWRVRAWHVTAYTSPFVLVLLVTPLSWPRYGILLASIWVTHFITDSRRWVSDDNWAPRPILVDQAIHIMSLGLLGLAVGL